MLPRSSLCAYQGRSNWSCDQSKKAGKARDRNPKLCWRARIAECEITRSYLIRVFCQLNQTRRDWSTTQKSCAIVLPTTVHIVNVCILCVIPRSRHVAFGIYLMFVYCAYMSAIVYFLEPLQSGTDECQTPANNIHEQDKNSLTIMTPWMCPFNSGCRSTLIPNSNPVYAAPYYQKRTLVVPRLKSFSVRI